MTAAALASDSHTVTRGTYSKTPTCVTSGGDAFSESVSFGLVANGVVNLHPEAIKAGLGDTSACGVLGAASTA